MNGSKAEVRVAAKFRNTPVSKVWKCGLCCKPDKLIF